MYHAMRFVQQAVVLSAMLLVAPDTSSAQSIQSDYDRAYDFSQVKTYDYVPHQGGRPDPLAGNPMNERRIRAAIDSHFVARGITRDTLNPSIRVAYYAATRQRVNVQDWGYGPGRWGTRRLDVHEYTQGTLVLDLVDAASKELVWRGTASGTVELRDADRKIRDAVRKLFERYAKDTRPHS